MFERNIVPGTPRMSTKKLSSPAGMREWRVNEAMKAVRVGSRSCFSSRLAENEKQAQRKVTENISGANYSHVFLSSSTFSVPCFLPPDELRGYMRYRGVWG